MSPIQQMTYQPPGVGASTVEVLGFDQLRSMDNAKTQRADFHVLAVVDAGHGSVTVDFETFPLASRSVLWIHPGAVHRWDDLTELSGHLVLFTPTAPVTPVTRELAATLDPVGRWSIPDEDWRLVAMAISHLRLESATPATGAMTELPGILLSALLTRLRPPQAEARSGNTLFQLFQSSVEAHFRDHHDASYYARTLGYAPRTVSRAVRKATGRTAKEYITDRIVLEAKRLLIHDRFTAARCAAKLGFPTASSFSVFFSTAVGSRPGTWRAASPSRC